jgi:Ni,Fe-hydrogenase III small subunit/ferredoxin
MLEWITRGLHKGITTTRYPRREEVPPPGFRARVALIDADGADPTLPEVCPTSAIHVKDGRVSLDRGRCILCGLCITAEPTRFAFVEDYRTAARTRSAVVIGEPPVPVTEVARPALGSATRTLRKSIHIRHVDAGSDGAEEWEIAALTNPYYDMQRLGLFFTLAPRHADILLVTGGVTDSMRQPLVRAYDVMPGPKAVVAAGTDACSGGFAAIGGEVLGGIDRVLPVDVYIPGSPSSPIALLHGLLLAAGVLDDEVSR